MRKLSLLFMLLFAGGGVSGCDAVLAGGAIVAANEAFKDGPNVTAQNYAVADYLAQQADSFIEPNDLIRVEPLTDVEAPDISTDLARVIPEQIGVRLSQLGYRVDLSAVTTTPDTSYLKGAAGEQPSFILGGNYLRKWGETDIKTRIIDLKNNRVVAAFDYILESGYEIRKMNDPKPRIMRVEKTETP